VTPPLQNPLPSRSLLNRLYTSSDSWILPGRTFPINFDQWFAVVARDLEFQLQRRDRHGITPCSVYRAACILPCNPARRGCQCTANAKTVKRRSDENRCSRHGRKHPTLSGCMDEPATPAAGSNDGAAPGGGVGPKMLKRPRCSAGDVQHRLHLARQSKMFPVSGAAPPPRRPAISPARSVSSNRSG
jgi:hypothetical protein